MRSHRAIVHHITKARLVPPHSESVCRASSSFPTQHRVYLHMAEPLLNGDQPGKPVCSLPLA